MFKHSKKIISLSLCSLILGGSVTAFANTTDVEQSTRSESIEVSESSSKKNVLYTLTNDVGNSIDVYKGIVDESEALDYNENRDIKHVLTDKETGHYVNVYKGTVDSDEENKPNIEVLTPKAISKPTTIKWGNFSSNWSGTVNFTYTRYAFPSGNFVAWADQPFSVILYDYKYDTSFPRIHAKYINGRYEVETGGGNFTYYCTLSNTNKGVPMTNAVYMSIPYWWHSN